MLSVEDLLAGADVNHQIEVPSALVPEVEDRTVVLRALTVRDLRLIAKAVQDNEDLSGALMVRHALVEPTLSLEQIGALPAGLLHFLLDEVNRISGITASEDDVLDAMEDPLVRASLMLSRELGWTPDQIGKLTLGETMLHVAALRRSGG